MAAFLAFSGLLAGAASASVVEIPYSGGKVSGSHEVSLYSGSLGSGTYRATPDSLRIAAVTLRFFVQPGPYPTVCGYKPPIGMQVIVGSFGAAWQAADTSSAWSDFQAFPQGSAIPLDSVTGASFQEPYTDTLRAPGYFFVEAGERNSCDGSEFSFRSHWNRVIFARWGSGVDYAAKISIRSYQDTTFGMLPMYQVLRSVSVHYVVNTTSTDLVPIRPGRPEQARSRFGAKVEHDLYNPLGIKIRRESGRYEPTVTVPRKR